MQTFHNFVLCFNLVKHSDCFDTWQIFSWILGITYVVIGKPDLLNKPCPCPFCVSTVVTVGGYCTFHVFNMDVTSLF